MRFDGLVFDNAYWDDADLSTKILPIVEILRRESQRIFRDIHTLLIKGNAAVTIHPNELMETLHRKYKIKLKDLRLPEWQHFISEICMGRPYHPAGTLREKGFRVESKYFTKRLADCDIGFLRAHKPPGLGKERQENIYSLVPDFFNRLSSPQYWAAHKNPSHNPSNTSAMASQDQPFSRRGFLQLLGIPLSEVGQPLKET